MGAEMRAAAVIRGASALTQPKTKPEFSGARWRAFVFGIKPYLGIIGAFVLMALLYAQKSHVIGLIDHQISEISVSGHLNKLTDADISAKLQPWLESSFLTADLDQIKADVQALPWVYQSTVTRIWPGKIIVNAIEQIPVAKWNTTSYLNASGDVFTPEYLDWDEALPTLYGPDASALAVRLDILESLGGLQRLLEPHSLNATQLELKSRGVWEAQLTNGVLVALGKQPFEHKVQRIGAVLSGASTEAVARMETIDTRYPNGLAIKWKDDAEQTILGNKR